AHTSSFASKLSSVCNPKPLLGETRLLDTTYGWDNVNQINMVVDNLNAANTQSFTFTDRGELWTAQGPGGAHTYAYSPAGNLKQRDGVTYTYQAHRLATGSDGTSLQYEPNGNVSSRSVPGSSSTLNWDSDDQLASVTRNGLTTKYAYGFDGERIKKVDPD